MFDYPPAFADLAGVDARIAGELLQYLIEINRVYFELTGKSQIIINLIPYTPTPVVVVGLVFHFIGLSPALKQRQQGQPPLI